MHLNVFSTFGTICDGEWGNPATVNDSRAARQLMDRFWDPCINPALCGMLCDSAFKTYADQVTLEEAQAHRRAGVYRPMTATDVAHAPKELVRILLQMSAWVVTCRQADEWGNGAFWAAFPRVTVPLQFVLKARHQEDVMTCAWLFNLRVHWVGYNQLATTYKTLVDDRYRALLSCNTVEDYVATAERMVGVSGRL